MHCPLCKSELLNKDGILVCPKTHGYLVTGKQLREIEKTTVPDKFDHEISADDESRIVDCPNCQTQMNRVNYNATGITIDTCPKCQYRWLDYGEVAKIKTYQPKLQAEHLIFLSDFQQKSVISPKAQTTGEAVNSRIPGYADGYGGFIRGFFIAGDDTKTVGYLFGASVFGLARSMMKSKMMRIVAPILIAVIIFFMYLAVKAIKNAFVG